MISQSMIEDRLSAYETTCAQATPRLHRSHQREVIYRLIAATDEHPTAEAVFEAAQKQVPSLSLATVYKNIGLLADIGLLREVRGLKGPVRYDANVCAHHHFACQQCSQVMDIATEGLEAAIAAQPGLQGAVVHGVDILVHGVCPSCSAKNGDHPN